MFMKLTTELHGEGLLNQVAIKYCALGFVVVGIGLLCVIGLQDETEISLDTNLDTYVEAHSTTHELELGHIEAKIDDLMDQQNTNYAAGVIRDALNTKVFERLGVAQEHANLKRIIERSTDMLPEIYYEDRDNYAIRLSSLDEEIASLKEQM